MSGDEQSISISEQDVTGTGNEEPTAYSALTAEEWRNLLAATDHILRISDGTKHGTFLFWVPTNGTLRWRCLAWTASDQANLDHLRMELADDDTTTQLVSRGGV